MFDLLYKTVEVPVFVLIVSTAFLLVIILVETLIIKDLSEIKPFQKKKVNIKTVRTGFLGKPIYSMSILAILAIFALGSAVTYNNKSLMNQDKADEEITLEVDIKSEKVGEDTYKTYIYTYPYSNGTLFGSQPYNLKWSIDGNKESTKTITGYSDSLILLFIPEGDHKIDMTLIDANNKKISNTYTINPQDYLDR